MPPLFPHVIGHAWSESNNHFVLALAGMNSEAAAQSLFQGKFLEPPKELAGAAQALNPGGHKGADVFAQVIISEQKPFAIDVGQMIWIDNPLLGLLLARLTVGQFQLLAGGSSLGQTIKNFQIQNGFGARSE